VLKRIANLLFWTARNLERAEWRARLIDVNYHLLVESPGGPNDGWLPMLAITGDRAGFFSRYPAPEERLVLAYYTIDKDDASSIKNCISFARENCRSLRNRISSELWVEINTLFLESQSWTAQTYLDRGVYGFFLELRDRFYRLSGVLENTMPRDESYYFLSLGRMLEAAENVTRLLDVKYHFLLPRFEDVGSALDLAQWAALLRSASALEAYTARYGSPINIERVADLLLFDPGFPRAARFSIERAVSALGAIAAGGNGGNEAREIPAAPALLKRLSDGSAAAVIEGGLHEFLLGVQEDCAKISDEVFARYLSTD